MGILWYKHYLTSFSASFYYAFLIPESFVYPSGPSTVGLGKPRLIGALLFDPLALLLCYLFIYFLFISAQHYLIFTDVWILGYLNSFKAILTNFGTKILMQKVQTKKNYIFQPKKIIFCKLYLSLLIID